MIEGAFVSDVRQAIDKRVRLIDPCRLTVAYLGSSMMSALSAGHRFHSVSI